MFKSAARLRSRARATDQRPPASWPSGLRAIPWRVLGVIAAGGVIGALAREGIWALFPHRAGAFDWATLAINVTGCALIGALMTVTAQARHLHRLLPPFLASGVLGGFTTFSTYIVSAQQSVDAGAPGIAAAYLGGTLAAALAAVQAGRWVARLVLRRHEQGKLRREQGKLRREQDRVVPLPWAPPNGEQYGDPEPRALQDLEER